MEKQNPFERLAHAASMVHRWRTIADTENEYLIKVLAVVQSAIDALEDLTGAVQSPPEIDPDAAIEERLRAAGNCAAANLQSVVELGRSIDLLLVALTCAKAAAHRPSDRLDAPPINDKAVEDLVARMRKSGPYPK